MSSCQFNGAHADVIAWFNSTTDRLMRSCQNRNLRMNILSYLSIFLFVSFSRISSVIDSLFFSNNSFIMSDPKNPNIQKRNTPQWGLYQREMFWKDNTGEVPPFDTEPGALEDLAKETLTKGGWCVRRLSSCSSFS
jgi:hypothetical protein